MSDLLTDVVRAHGGLDRWRQLTTMRASIASGGALWGMPGVAVGPDNLLRRHDYHVDVAGGFAAAQYVYDPVEVDGIVLPTRQLAYRRDADRRAILDPLMVSIAISDIRFS